MNNDDTMREKVAKLWLELNGVEITPEMINCVGYRIDGVKTRYYESLCPIRLCTTGRGMGTCGNCSEMESCEKLRAITEHNSDALKRLKTGTLHACAGESEGIRQLQYVRLHLLTICRTI